jgi:hypothetical protein
VSLLHRCLALIPSVIPPDDICYPILWHPDLSLSNILVAPAGPANILGLIDWQGTCITPYFMQANFPPAFAYTAGLIEMPPGPLPILPAGIEQRDEAEQNTLRLHYRLALRHKKYEYMMSKDAQRTAACSGPNLLELSMFPYYVVRLSSDGAPPLRQALMEMASRFENHTSPILFTPEEIELHDKEFAGHTSYQMSVEALNGAIEVEGDGWVDNENYEKVKKRLAAARSTWDPTETDGPFPYDNGRYSFFLC